ncbi:hypothetical protein [Priestia megaterium]|uniref:Uncharacterized protein n=1 Tax=Priestia megaterium TaxID=1404 RepID=A0A6M6E038_PRIMG|nr:hypothetical protein [Priestia megaterium]QJX80493.1 hypothetical protein FDZ14_30870 [Priestia megaterium]
MVLVLILIAILIVGICLVVTKKNKRARVMVGIVLILFSFLNYPVISPFFIRWNGLEGTVSLIIFNLVVLLGGITTLSMGVLCIVQSRKY